VLRVSQLAAVGAVALIVAAAMLSARFGGGALRVHPLAFAFWGLGAAVSAMALARSASDPVTRSGSWRRTATSGTLLVALMTCVSGVVASAGGAAGPAWILFLPIVLVCGAVSGPIGGLASGGLAAAGIYVSAGVSHTLDLAGIGHLVVILPACPAAGWAAGALARLAHAAAAEAARQRAALERDVQRLGEVLAVVAGGDLTRVPAPGDSADPVATTLAVVFADTLLALRRLVRQMHGVTEQLASSSSQLSRSAATEADGVDAQTVAVTETTETIAQLAATAESIAELSERVAFYAGSTRRDVEHGVGAVQATGAAMDVIAARVTNLATRSVALRERIGRVGDTTRLIDELARRTSILSVNASIEAARAGEHGHGFATVAGEVTSLAARARSATGQIAAILAELEEQAVATAVAGQEGLAAVRVGAERQAEVATYLRQIARMVDRTTAATREITAASRDQRIASGAVVEAMTLVTGASERYRHGSRGYAAAARRMSDLVEMLKSTLAPFKVT
jgi:methyl-accepting chemotaxis protein